jgi:uncharacterized membrane protein HdeD (DUF308 family)
MLCQRAMATEFLQAQIAAVSGLLRNCSAMPKTGATLSAGAAAIVVHFRLYRAQGLRYLLFSAVLSTIAGLALLVKPLSGVISLTVIIIVCFTLAGVTKLTFPLDRFRYLLNYRGWIRASGIIDLMLAALMFADQKPRFGLRGCYWART